MNAKQKIHQAKLNHWMSLFQQQAASGLTIRQWCEQNNCSFHSFNYIKLVSGTIKTSLSKIYQKFILFICFLECLTLLFPRSPGKRNSLQSGRDCKSKQPARLRIPGIPADRTSQTRRRHLQRFPEGSPSMV